MTAMKQPLGTLLVVSGPSGSGKTTLCRRATENGLCVYSISCTTRQPRPGEVNGVDYHFLTPAEFDARVERGDFLEYAEVHGNRYGTLKADILTLLEQGKNVVMDIDVQGAGQVRSCREGILPLCYADVYIYVPQAELKNRLCGRQTDGAETIARWPTTAAFAASPGTGRRLPAAVPVLPGFLRPRDGLCFLLRPAQMPVHAGGTDAVIRSCLFIERLRSHVSSPVVWHPGWRLRFRDIWNWFSSRAYMVCDSLSSDPACVKKRGLKFLTGRILIGSLNNSMLKLSSRQRTSEEVSR